MCFILLVLVLIGCPSKCKIIVRGTLSQYIQKAINTVVPSLQTNDLGQAKYRLSLENHCFCASFQDLAALKMKVPKLLYFLWTTELKGHVCIM